jgi:hypothetical protein
MSDINDYKSYKNSLKSLEIKDDGNKKKSKDTRNFNSKKKVKVKSKLKNTKFYGYSNIIKY